MFCDDADVDQFAVFYGSSSSCPDGNTTTTNSTLDLNITSQVLPFGVCALSNGRYMKIVEVKYGYCSISSGTHIGGCCGRVPMDVTGIWVFYVVRRSMDN
jgi:hypothetical protein